MSLTFIDTHCHLDLQNFDADRGQVLERAAHAGVRRILVPSLNRESATRVTALVDAHTNLFAAVGIHPTEINGLANSDLDAIRSLAFHDKVVALGEIGLDYFWQTDASSRRDQRDALCAQLNLARQVQRPVVLHMREERDAETGACTLDMLGILADWVGDLTSSDAALAHRPGVLHSFAGSLETAMRAITLGFFIGVTGPVTYKNRENLRRVVAQLPLEHLLVETDAPFLSPEPHRGRRNEPGYIIHIADRIAQVQSRTLRDVADVTTANATRLFAWEATS